MKTQRMKKKKPSLNRVHSNKNKRLEMRNGKFDNDVGSENDKSRFTLQESSFQLLTSNFSSFLLFLFILLLPTQLGKHFFFDFSYLSGVRVDYLAPTIYLTDILALLLLFLNLKSVIRWFINKKILILLLILLINLLFSQNIFISVYRYIKIIEFICIIFIFRQARLSKR